MKKPQLMFNLRTRLIGMFLLISLLLGGSVTYFVHDRAQEALSASVEDRLANISLLKEAELNRWGAGIGDKLESLAQRPLVRERVVSLVMGAGTPDPELRMDLLENHFLPALRSEGFFKELFVIRAEDGQILISTEKEEEGKYRESEVFFEQGLVGTYLDTPHYVLEAGEAVLHASTPIRDFEGEVIAVLAAHTDLNEFSAIISQAEQFSHSMETYLVNQANLIVTENRFRPDSSLSLFNFSEGIESCLAGDTGTAQYVDYRGVPVVGAFRWMTEWDLCLVTEQDQAEAFALKNDLTKTTVLVGSLVTLLAMVGGLLFAQTIIQPLKSLTLGALEFGRGNFDYEVEVHSRDELGQLAESFNEMKSNLSETIDQNITILNELRGFNTQLEVKVEERTLELKDAQLAAMNMMEDAMQARREAEENEVRFRALFEDSPISLWEEDFSQVKSYLDKIKNEGVQDLESYFSQHPRELDQCLGLIIINGVNRQTLKTFEAADKEALIKGLDSTLVPESSETMIRELAALGSGATRFEAEMAYQTLKGKQIWGNLVVSIPAGFEESWSKVLVSIMDITEQKEAQQAILEEKDFSEQIINSIPGIFYVFNTDGRFIRWNENFAQVSEYSAEEILTMHPTVFFTGDEQGRVAERIGEVFTQGSASVMANFTSKSGIQKPYFLTGLRAVIEGEMILVGTGVDISERVAAEEALEEKALDLKRSNEDLEQFAYVASHDLQEPLRMVASYLQLLDRRYGDELSAEAREFMAFAVDGATRMKQLINDLLAFSRVGTQGGEFQDTDLNRVVGVVHNNLMGLIEETGAIITHDELPVVAADETQMQQLYQNLIGNAIKFRKDDQAPAVHLGAEKKNGLWQMSVSDNGIGLDPQFKDRIFVLFQRLHGTEKYQGTGIGLAVSKRIIDRHGGRIWVESQAGEGATFFFTLPNK